MRETSGGALTELAFDAEERGLTLTFEPSERYGLADVEGCVEKCPGNCFIHDFEDALLLWGDFLHEKGDPQAAHGIARSREGRED